jgi:hypothetical protein
MHHPGFPHRIARLAAAHHSGQLEFELKKIRRYKLIIIDRNWSGLLRRGDLILS